MKKLLSVLLALVMVFSLTAPALAAEIDPPASEPPSAGDGFYSNGAKESWAALCAEQPEETARFLAELPAWFEEEFGEYGYDYSSFDKYVKDGGYSCAEAAYLDLFEYWGYDPVQAWAALCAEQPEETARFLAELPEWFAEEYDYFDSFEQYAGYCSCEEEAYLQLFSEWSYDPAAEWAQMCAAEPERTAKFLAELDTWFAQRYSWYDSFEEYCENYDYSAEEAYLELFYIWNRAYTQQQEQEQAKRDFITARSGVPGQINVMLNGQYVKFPDAVPELTEGRTMVPFRAIFEALGAEVTYEDGKVHAVLGDTVLDLTIGSDTLTKTVAGKAGAVKMDCAPYIKNGRTYVPVRFISEALGYDVQWDSYYQSAVLTDLDALAEKIDKDFTIYNKLAAKSALTEKTQKSVGSGKADVTLFDTLNGDKTGKATYSYDLAASTAGASGKMEYDFTELWALIEGYIPMPLDLAGEEEYTQTLELVKSLMKGSLDVRVDLERGKAYLSMPGLFEAMAGYLEESGMQLPKDAWLSASLTGDNAEMDELIAMMSQTLTVGKLLTTTAGSASVSGAYAAQSYENILKTAEVFGALYGDGKFTRKGNAYELTLTKEDLAALVEDDSYSASLDALSKFEYSLTVKDNGDVDVSAQMRVALASSAAGLNLGDAMELSVKGTVRGGKTEQTMEVHVKNVLKATITLQQTVTETDKAPETTPPKDALVLPVDGTLPGGTITSPDGPTQLLP